jgi:hypothetical protein
MAAYLDAQGNQHQLENLAVTAYREAAEVGMTLPQYVNQTYPTDSARFGSTWNQLMESEGIFVRGNRDLGIRASTMDEILNGPKTGPKAGVVVKDGVPTSRILFPAVILQLIEDKLLASLTMTANAFEEMIASDETITGERYEQPVVNFDKPSVARHQGIAQLTAPPSMLTITVSDKAYKIPTFSLGMEISDQAIKATTLDIVAMSLARQAAIERNERAQNYVLALLNGDNDNGEASLSSLGRFTASSTLDSAATGGVFTHKAWMKYLMLNGTKRSITHLITDFDTAWKIETRTGKPTVTGDDSKTSRIDTQFQLMNPTWAQNPKIFLTDISSWPANTILGLDKNWAIRRVRNLQADYTAIESYVMRRSQAMRFDFGEHVNRLYTEAFDGLTLS